MISKKTHKILDFAAARLHMLQVWPHVPVLPCAPRLLPLLLQSLPRAPPSIPKHIKMITNIHAKMYLPR